MVSEMTNMTGFEENDIMYTTYSKNSTSYLFNHIYPQMVKGNMEAHCHYFLQYLQMVIIHMVSAPDLYALEDISSTAPPRITDIFDVKEQLIQYHLPLLNQNLAAMQQSQIPTQIIKFS